MSQENDLYPVSAGVSIPYIDNMLQEEQLEVTGVLRLLLNQTFVLERKYDKRTGRLQYTREYRICSKHLEFIKKYFSILGIDVIESSHMGMIYIQGENLAGDKLPRLATLYLLALKLIYDEQMETASTSIQVYTSLGEIHEKLGSYRLFRKQPSPTDIRRTVTLLKKYQIIEPLELLEDLDSASRLIIYPCINVVLMGDDIRALISTFEEENGERIEEGPDERTETAEEDIDGTDEI